MLSGRKYYIAALSLGIPAVPSFIEGTLGHFFPFVTFISLFLAAMIDRTIVDVRVLEKTYNAFILGLIAILLLINGQLQNSLYESKSA
jgi:hypothetical protein